MNGGAKIPIHLKSIYSMTADEYDAILEKGMSIAEHYSIELVIFAAGTESTGNFQFATGSLIRVKEGVALVTSAHVLQEFVAMGSEGRLQLGPNQFVLRPSSARVLRFAKKIDISVLILSEEEALKLGEPILECDQIVAREVRRFELIGFCGYPGATKTLIGSRRVAIQKYLLSGIIDTVELDQFSIRTDEHRYEIPPRIEGQPIRPLGGISGAPVFSFVTGEPHMTKREIMSGIQS